MAKRSGAACLNQICENGNMAGEAPGQAREFGAKALFRQSIRSLRMSGFILLSSYYAGSGDGQAALANLFNAAAGSGTAPRGIALIDVSVPLASPLTIAGKSGLVVRSLPSAAITVQSGMYISMSGCTDCDVEWNLTGTLSTSQQYSQAVSGVASFFGSGVTYEKVDNAGTTTTIDGSDFYHSLSGNILSMGMMDATGSTPIAVNDYQRRRVISDFIPLNAANRWFVDVLPGAVAGAGLNAMQFRLYDASGTYLGPYLPSDADGTGTYMGSSFTHFIQSAAKMKIVLETNRTYRTGQGYIGQYDLSKVNIYQVVADLAAQSAASSPGDTGCVYLGNCTRVRLGGSYSNILTSAIVMNNPSGPGCVDCEVSDATFRQCAQGVTVNYSLRSRILRNVFDMRYQDTSGNWLGNRVFRLRCVGGIYADATVVRSNIMRGSSWAVELITYTDAYSHNVDDNVIEAEFCGISSAFNGSVKGSVSRNKITVSALAGYGIELAGGSTSERAEAMDNDITFLGHCGPGYGYAVSGFTQAIIAGGKIDAPVGCSATSGTELVFEPDHVSWSAAIVFSQAQSSTVTVRSSKQLFMYHMAIPNYYMAMHFQPGGGARAASVRYASFQAVSARHYDVNIVDSASTFGTALISGFVTGASWDLRHNSLNGKSSNIVGGASVPPGAITGATLLQGQLASVAPGPMAAGAMSVLGTVSVKHLAAGDRVSASPVAAGGLPGGFVVVPRITADETVQLSLLNLSGASATPSASAWTVWGDKAA
jgi:hypothetical protein